LPGLDVAIRNAKNVLYARDATNPPLFYKQRARSLQSHDEPSSWQGATSHQFYEPHLQLLVSYDAKGLKGDHDDDDDDHHGGDDSHQIRQSRGAPGHHSDEHTPHEYQLPHGENDHSDHHHPQRLFCANMTFDNHSPRDGNYGDMLGPLQVQHIFVANLQLPWRRATLERLCGDHGTSCDT